jgi:flagellin
MSLNSVNTNVGAMVALQSLNMTNNQLAATEKRISTGYRVADATDDGAAYAVAQRVRSDVSSLGSANQQLGGVQGLLSTTSSALNDVSTLMNTMRQTLVSLSNGNTSGTQRTQYAAQYNSLLANVKSDIQNASYNGKTLIGNITGSTGTFSKVAVTTNESGSTYGIATFGGSAMYGALALGATTLASATLSAAAITATGAFMAQLNSLGTQMNNYGNATNYVNNQISYNSDKVNSLNSGLGALVDANLAQESAMLQSLQIRQQLGTQALSLANQAPQSLLSLFK